MFSCASTPQAGPSSAAPLRWLSSALFASARSLGVVLLVLAVFFLFFFRDPERAVTQAPGRRAVAGGRPRHGRRPPTARTFPPGSWQQISIFLSPMDVHVNRMPVSGRVTKVKYHPGRFLPAYRADAGDLNEYTEVWIDHGGQTIVVRQIVGILARRIVCRAQEGDDGARRASGSAS